MGNWTWACVHAKVAARSNVAGLLYSSARASASSRDGAMSVEKVTRARAPGASRTRRRRLTIGSSTAPTVWVLESGWPSMTDIGVRIPRPRPRNRARSVSYCSSPTVFPFGDDYVRRPDLGLAVRPWPARSQQGTEFGSKFRLHKQVGKCRWAASAAGGARTISAYESARSLGFVGLDCDGHPAHLRVVLRRNNDFKRGRNRAIAPPDLQRDPRKRPLHSCPVQPRSVGMRPTRLAAVCVRTKTYVPQASHVRSSRHRVTARSRQSLYPEPAVVTITTYRPLERRWTAGESDRVEK